MRVFFVVIVMVMGMVACKQETKMVQKQLVLVGTYTDGDSKGIYSYSFDPSTGILDSMQLMAQLPNPSFLAISKDKDNLYAVQETSDFDSLGGGVTAFKFNGDVLEQQNSFGTEGAHPCHVALSADGQLAVSNYSGGNLAIFDLNADGSLQADPQHLDHKVLDSVKAAHVHKTHFNADGLFVADLGLDAIKRYQRKNGAWIPSDQPSLDMGTGAGPRHFIFKKDGNFLYILNELNASVTAMQRNGDGKYVAIQTEPTLPPDYEGVNACADIHLSPDGLFLYLSNRGENTLVIFAVDDATGKLTLIGRESVHGDWPRNFTIDPSGNYILVANQKSNNITVFKRDVDQGTLTFLHEVATPTPVCLVFR